MLRSLLVLVVTLPVLLGSAIAAERLLEPALENRAKALFLQLRCVVCQNQSIGDSDADVAKDLREIVREQIGAGKTDAEIKDFLVARYGEFILLKPVFGWHTFILWAAPALLLILGGALAWRASSKRPQNPSAQKLSKAEEEELSKILNS